MASASTKFTPDELESIFIWDLLCEAVPLTADERRDSRERDDYASGIKTPNARTKKPLTDEQRQKKLEAKRKYRETHKAQIAAYREEHRQEIRERQREYDKAQRKNKRVEKRSICDQAQP